MKCLILANKPSPLESFKLTEWTCSCHDSLLSMKIPRYLAQLTYSRFSLLILRLRTNFLHRENDNNLDFLTLRNSWMLSMLSNVFLVAVCPILTWVMRHFWSRCLMHSSSMTLNISRQHGNC